MDGNSHSTTPVAEPQRGATRPVVFFDGVCGLCNRFVDFVLPRDRRETFRFAPLQGETAREMLRGDDAQSLNSVVLRTGSGEYRHSSAVVRILWGLGGVWKVAAALLWVVPAPLRDVGYRLVARNRYRLFGRKEACRMPSAEERRRFLP